MNTKPSIFFKVVLFMVLLLTSMPYAQAQSLVTKTFRFNLATDDIVMPPDLYVDIDFVDANDNKILEALEKGEIKLVISNKGGAAENVKIKVTPSKEFAGLTFGTTDFITSIESDNEVSFRIPVEANIDIPTDSVRLDFAIAEPLGYDINATMLLSTFGFQKPILKMQGVTIIDAGKGLKAFNNNPDGMLQKGEVARACITVQNIGNGEASDITYTVLSSDPNVFIITDKGFKNKTEGTLKDLKVGETAEIDVRISPNNRYQHNSQYIPLYLTVNEKYNMGNITAENVPIPLGKTRIRRM